MASQPVSSADESPVGNVRSQSYESLLGIGNVFMSDHPGNPSSWGDGIELRGKIKFTPQDFVVQEILDFQHLSLAERVPGDSTDTDTIKVAQFDEKPLELPSYMAGRKVVPPTDPALSTCPQSEQSQIEIDWTAAATDPKGVLRDILKASSSSMKLGGSIEQTVRDLNVLQARACDQLGAVEVDDKVTITLEGKSTRTDRGLIHQWVRAAFSLLQTEAVQAVGDKAPQERTVISIFPDKRFHDLATYLHDPRRDIPRLYEFFRAGNTDQNRKNGSNQRGGWKSTHTRLILALRPDIQRSERRPIHQILDTKSGRQFQTETITDYRLEDSQITSAIAVTWSANRKRKRQERSQTKNFILVLRKRNVEHVVAMHTLAKALRCRISDIQYAGIKDRTAVTTQFISLNHFVLFPRIVQAQTELRKRGLDLCGPLIASNEGLRLGQHLGNRFTITLREIVQVSSAITLTGKVEEGCIACPRARIEEAVERVRRNGFVNFFGEQRIGAIHVDPGTRAVDIGRAMLQQDWTKAVDVIMLIGTDASSLKVSRVWRESGRDVQATWKALAKSQGSQSRQRMLLQTLRRQGTDDCSVALKSLSYSERAFWINAYQSYVWNQAATARIRLYGSDKVKMGDLVQCQQNTSTGQPILVVSEEMAEQYSIRDVVLPLPGYRVQYPSNKVSQVYRDASICDGIEYVKDAPLDATAKGSYRPLVAVADNIASEWVDEDDQTVMTCRFMFDLPSGSYATMLLRELLRTNDACRETALEL